MTGNDVQAILENLFDELKERHVCDDDCRANGCDHGDDDDWKDEIDCDGALAECDVTSYEHGGYLTRDAGLVLRLPNGDEFQITVVQTAYARDDESADETAADARE